MKLLYLDESGSTGTDLDNKNQPFFVLTGICVEDKNWHKVNDYFEEQKNKIYPDFKNIEIHTNEIFNSNSKSTFDKNDWKFNYEILENLADLISNLDIKVLSVEIYKKSYKKYLGNNIIVDPYLYSFSIIYKNFNEHLSKNNDYAIIFCDELKRIESGLEILYPKLNVDNKNVIEKTFYLNSKKNNFIQMADFCSFYINKYKCIKYDFTSLSDFKKNHCIKIYEKFRKSILNSQTEYTKLNEIDTYFK